MTELLLIPAIGILILVGFLLLILGIKKKKPMWLTFAGACWVLSFICGWAFMNSEFIAIDKCLDSGGKYNYEAQVCEYE